MKAAPVKSKIVVFKVTPDQYSMIEQRAQKCGVRLSVWIRSLLLQAVDRPAKKGYLRVREPNGTNS